MSRFLLFLPRAEITAIYLVQTARGAGITPTAIIDKWAVGRKPTNTRIQRQLFQGFGRKGKGTTLWTPPASNSRLPSLTLQSNRIGNGTVAEISRVRQRPAYKVPGIEIALSRSLGAETLRMLHLGLQTPLVSPGCDDGVFLQRTTYLVCRDEM